MRRFVSLVVIVLCLAAVAANAGVIYINSGNAPQGQTDPSVTVRGADCVINGVAGYAAPAPLQQASVLSYLPAWGSAPTGSKWISIADGGRNNTPNGGYLFETRFDLPTSFTVPGLTISAKCDNRLSVYLNSHFLGETTGSDNYYSNTIFSTSTASFFTSGSNLLQFYVLNDYDTGNSGPSPMGLAFSAQIGYMQPTPEPSGLLALLCMAGSAGVMWRRRK